MQQPDINGLFERIITYPDFDPKERFSRLVGIDDHKERLTKMLSVLVNPISLEKWAREHHPDAIETILAAVRRPPLIVLAGDVGTGKTELAETIGDAVARQEGISITLFPMSLSSRGQGRVGEMTQLLSTAFEYIHSEASKFKKDDAKISGAAILLVDEADALAQSREDVQMHHEDRAGVNAFIRGIDRISNSQLPAAVIMCTNRLDALDPAVRRRAADIIIFRRPNKLQRFAVIGPTLLKLGLSKQEIQSIVIVTGKRENTSFGFTYSDLTQRLLPAVILDAYPTNAVSAARVLEIASRIEPTKPFGGTT